MNNHNPNKDIINDRLNDLQNVFKDTRRIIDRLGSTIQWHVIPKLSTKGERKAIFSDLILITNTIHMLESYTNVYIACVGEVYSAKSVVPKETEGKLVGSALRITGSVRDFSRDTCSVLQSASRLMYWAYMKKDDRYISKETAHAELSKVGEKTSANFSKLRGHFDREEAFLMGRPFSLDVVAEDQ